MDESAASIAANKKKRKITELISLYDPRKSALPPPLEDPALAEGSKATIKRSKVAETSYGEIVLPPPPNDQPQVKKRVLKHSNSRPKLSGLSTSERRLRERQRTEAANEILSSERSYVATLESFVNVRPNPAVCFKKLTVEEAELSNFAYPLSASKSGLISEADRSLICSEIEMILQLNRAFLTQIAERMRLFTPKTPISDIFLSFMPHFKMYTVYCCKHVQITDAVMRLKNDNKGFKAFVKKAETSAKHLIGDFLIAPVQRVPRLALLIDSLLKFTDSTHPDFEQLKVALEEAQNAARLINTKMHEVEVRSKVVAIQKSFDPMINDFLDGPLVQPHRVFVHEGVMARKNGAANFEDDDWSDSEEEECDKQEESEKGKYYCFLFNDILLVGTSIGKGKTKRLVYETSFELATTFIREDMNGLCWQLVNPRCTYTWLCHTTQEVADWKRLIEETVETLLKNSQLRVQRSRVEVSFDEETNEWFAEIKATPRAVQLDPVQYREEVLENTQKHLTQFMHEHHAALAKHRSTFGSPKKLPSASVFQRVKDSFTPKKRTSVRFGDENSISNVPSSPAPAYSSPMAISVISNTSLKKGDKNADQPIEELDGVSCVNRHLEMLNQELQAVRELRRQARQQEIAGLTSPSRRLTRCESTAVRQQDATIRQLKTVLSTARLPQLSAIAPPATVEANTHKKQMLQKAADNRATLATPSLSSASSRRSTLADASIAPSFAPGSPITIPQRASDTNSVGTRKPTPKRKGRMSLGGAPDAHRSITKLPAPLSLADI